MRDLRELISSEDKEKINAYINLYADIEDNTNYNNIDIDHILRLWGEGKNNYLANMFGDQLILSKEVEFSEGEEEIQKKVSDFIKQYDSFIDKIIAPYKAKSREYWNQYWRDGQINEDLKKASEDYGIISTLFNAFTLAANRVNASIVGNSGYSLTLGAKTLKIMPNSKPMKTIKQLAEHLGVNDFEEFRNAHSLCLNTKKLSGNLCLSIHPLDYMTMSDNNSSWGSCMSWANYGEYRQGTVEMMNSSCVVEAYLTASSPYYFYHNSKEYAWNNKKWRCLFIVDNDFAINIREYPYHNPTLVQETLKWIGSLMHFGEDSKIYKRDSWVLSDSIKFNTNAMYNDMECDYDHYLIVNSLGNYVIDTPNAKTINYSGPSECMFCGDTIYIDYNENKYLTCDHCGSRPCCCHCGERINVEDATYFNGEEYCSDCAADLFIYDEVYDEYIRREDSAVICLLPENTSPNKTKYARRIYTNRRYLKDSAREERLFTLDQFHHLNGEEYYVSTEECTKSGLKLFDILTDEELTRYKEYMKKEEHFI